MEYQHSMKLYSFLIPKIFTIPRYTRKVRLTFIQKYGEAIEDNMSSVHGV